MGVIVMKERRLRQLAKSFLFRKKMSETLNEIGHEIRAFLLSEEKNEVIVGGFKISIREDDLVEITKLPPLSLEQLELPLK
jgi:hypothetical protein